jgi:hypothetical protein
MRRARRVWIALLLLFPLLTGCLGNSTSRAQFFNRLPFLNSTDPTQESAFIEYVMIDRPAGRDEINRRVWDRVDEQVIHTDIRIGLEAIGLRIGTISDSMPGVLRGMVDDPRTNRGHRFRSFAADKTAALIITPENKRVDFTMPNGTREPIQFTREKASLGFEISVKELPDNKVQVRLVPIARFYDPTLFVPTHENGIREEASETFPTGAIDIVVSASEYIVIGTEYYTPRTFGHNAFVGHSTTLERSAQRVLVLRAGLTKAERSAPKLLNGKDDPSGTLPIASQASIARGQKP